MIITKDGIFSDEEFEELYINIELNKMQDDLK